MMKIDVQKGSAGIYDAIINVSILIKDVSPLSFMKSQLGEVSKEKLENSIHTSILTKMKFRASVFIEIITKR